VAAEGGVLRGYPAVVIIREGAEHGCDLIVVHADNDELTTSLGRTADKVVTLADCVLVVR